MQGPPLAAHEDRGVIMRVAEQITNHVKTSRITLDESGFVTDCIVKVSYMEIYNEGLTDLLAPKAFSEGQGLKIRMDPDSMTGRDLFVQGLSERYVTTYDDYINILEIGSKNRTGIDC